MLKLHFQSRFYRSNAVLLGLGVTTLLAIVAVSFWLTTRSQSHFAEIIAARDLRSASADLLGVVQDAETGQRGFLLTRDPLYLEPYSVAAERFETMLASLGRAISGMPEVKDNVDRLTGHLRAKMAELAATVELGRHGAFDDALRSVREGQGKRLMDSARAEFNFVLGRSEARLQASIATQSMALSRLRLVTMVGALAILTLTAIGAWTISGYTRAILAARGEVEALNVGLEERVKERTEAFTRSNEEVQRFAYIVTHDLRAPLVNIMGFTSEVEAAFQPIAAFVESDGSSSVNLKSEAELALKTDVPEALGFIRSSTRKMDALINAILKISREGGRTLRAERIDLGQVLQASANAVHHQASSEGGAIAVDSQAGSIITDRLSLDQILGNLLDNAIKYRSPDRPIQIQARTRRENSGWIRIEIEDNGRGIADSDRERVFELFRRAGAQTTPGEGIGLAHVRALVRNLGGIATVSSKFGEGTTLTVRLPPDLDAVRRSTAT